MIPKTELGSTRSKKEHPEQSSGIQWHQLLCSLNLRDANSCNCQLPSTYRSSAPPFACLGNPFTIHDDINIHIQGNKQRYPCRGLHKPHILPITAKRSKLRQRRQACKKTKQNNQARPESLLAWNCFIGQYSDARFLEAHPISSFSFLVLISFCEIYQRGNIQAETHQTMPSLKRVIQVSLMNSLFFFKMSSLRLQRVSSHIFEGNQPVPALSQIVQYVFNSYAAVLVL